MRGTPCKKQLSPADNVANDPRFGPARSAEEEWPPTRRALNALQSDTSRLPTELTDLLREIPRLLRKPPRGRGATEDDARYFRLYYMPEDDDDLAALILKVKIAADDPLVPTEWRRRLRAFRLADYFGKPIHIRQPKVWPTPGFRRAYDHVLKLFQQRCATSNTILDAVVAQFPGRREAIKARAKSLSILPRARTRGRPADTETTPHRQARSALSVLFGVSIDTVESVLKKTAKKTRLS